MTYPDAVDTTSEPTARRSTRRALLGLGVVGAAVAASRTVSAATAPTFDDIATLVIGAELTARDLYRLAPSDMAAEGLPELLAGHHEAYAERISGIVGIPAQGQVPAIYDALSDAFEAGDLEAALGLENSLAATHAVLLAETDDINLLRAIASIVSAESVHAAVLASEAGADLETIIVNPAAPLAPEA